MKKIKNRSWHKKRYLEKKESRKNKINFISVPKFPKPKLYDSNDDFIDSFRIMLSLIKPKINFSSAIT